MKNNNLLEGIIEYHNDTEFLTIHGFDSCVIGLDETSDRLIYSVRLIIETLMIRDGMTCEEAEDYYIFNIENAYMGELTPIYCEDRFET